jgi:hypothetical protein
VIACREAHRHSETGKRLPSRAALLIVEPGVYRSRGQTIDVPIGAQNLGHTRTLVAGQQQQELRRSRARMSDQHRATLGQQPAHGRDLRIHRLNLQPELLSGILHETSQ